MEEFIQAIVRALGVGATLGQIRDAAIEKGWSEENIFLGMHAAQNLYNAIKQQEQELANRPAPFGRIK
jgi:hypothetical protein